MAKIRVKLKDVAAAAGVHASTVSRALDPKSRHLITDSLAERITRIANELQYRPNSIASSLRTQQSMTIGVLVPDITNMIFPPILRGIEDTLAEQGYVAIIANTDSDPTKESALIDIMRARGVDGLILASAQRQDAAIVQVMEDGAPVVTVNRMIDDERVSYVVNDETGGIGLAVQHVVDLGHRTIAHLAGPQRLSTGLFRYYGFCRAAKKHRLRNWRELIAFASAFNEDEGREACLDLIDRGIPFTAVITANDRLAMGAMQALASRGLRVPEDVSVTGYNDMPFTDLLTPPLTTVRIQTYEAGRRAGEIILERLGADRGTLPAVHEVLDVELVPRASTAAPPDEPRSEAFVARGGAPRPALPPVEDGNGPGRRSADLEG
tara:strand:+ start:6606 stop:7745 length:1140 start_codon:yes stop_codon:yes gene_type:complete